MDVFNLFEGELDESSETTGFVWRGATVGRRIGAAQLGMSVYELPEGERICPYHFHWASEEWLLVLEGEPVLRTPEGERTLRRGDVVCFPSGPAGAHAVTGPARVAMLATEPTLDVTEYPDSEKVSFYSPERSYLVRRKPELEYYDGEL